MAFIVSGAIAAVGTVIGVGTAATLIGGAAAIGLAGEVVSTGIGMYAATKDKKNAARAANGLQGEIDFLEETRQEIINPFEGVTDLSDMAIDLSSMAQNLSGMITDTSGVISNSMANLSVSTAAAEMQAEEADIALANTLDLLASTGSSAGGATALAQAALQSKKGVSASIEQQEKSNQDKAAKGEERVQNRKQQEAQRLQQAKFSEARRIENMEISEAGRLQQFGINQAEKMQDIGVKSELFKFNVQDQRETASLDRLASQLTGQQNKQAMASANYTSALTSGISNVAGAATDFAGMAFKASL